MEQLARQGTALFTIPLVVLLQNLKHCVTVSVLVWVRASGPLILVVLTWVSVLVWLWTRVDRDSTSCLCLVVASWF